MINVPWVFRTNLLKTLRRIKNPLSTKEWLGKEIDFNKSNLSSFLKPNNKIRGAVYEILLESGNLLTPSTSKYDPRAFFALSRYYNAFSNDKHLKIIENYDQIDSRIKSILSEEISIGITGFFLRNYVGISHIFDFELEKDPRGAKLSNRYGGKKPDFLCLTTDNDLYIVESKGALGTPHNVGGNSYKKKYSGSLKKGKNQVENVRIENPNLFRGINKLVLGTNLLINKENKKRYSKTTTHIVDPESDEEPDFRIEIDPKEIIINSYKKIFNSFGIGKYILSSNYLESNKYDNDSNRRFLEIPIDPENNTIIIDKKILKNIRKIQLENMTYHEKEEFFSHLSNLINESKSYYKETYMYEKGLESTHSFNNGIYFNINQGAINQ